MILFYKDWERYPGSVLHLNTKNESFLRLSSIYREMGIQNHTFLLALFQPELAELDPHDVDNLTLEQMAKIVYECKVNPWYFFREVARLPPLAGTEPIQFKVNRAIVALFWLFFNHITSILIIPRQTGKSASTDTLMIYLLNYGVTNTLINLLTRSDGLRDQNLDRMKKIQDELPYYLNFRSKGDIFNTEEIKLTSLGNNYKGNLSNMSPKLANNVGRGFTSPILHIDEACFIPNIAIALSAALMAGNAARDSAKQHNMPYGTILTTTAGKIDDKDGSYVHKLWNAATVWDEVFFDTTSIEELNEVILKNSNAGNNEVKRAIVNITMSYRQLGYDDKWMRDKLQETIAEGEDADRDLFNRWTSGSRSSPIPKEYIEIIKNSIMENYRTEIYNPYNYILTWYVSEDEIQTRIKNKHTFIAGVDTSDAVGKDDIAFILRDHVTGEILCTAVFNEINLITLASFFVDFLLKYPNVIMIIERRSSAPAIIDYMIQKLCLNNINPFTRLYNTIFQCKEEYEKEFEEITKARYYNEELFNKYKKYIGFATSGSGITSRSELYSSTLISMCKYTGYSTNDAKLVNQILSLIIKNNRVDHPDGGNDDMVISSLLSYWLLIKGKNLSYYGIDTSTILKTNRVYLNEKYSDNYEDEQEAIDIERKFLELIETYKTENNELIAKQIELKIKMIANELSDTHNKVISVSSLLEEINREKRLKLKRY